DLSIGQAYIYDDFDLEGDVKAFLAAMRRQAVVRRGWLQKLGLAWRLRCLPVVERQRQGRRAARLTGKQRSLERDRQASAYHYDSSNAFFASFLDPDLVYTCACFETPGDSLEQAQKQKLDLVCRKLRLQPGQRLLDVGCGWGQLLIHAAQEYGVEAVG